MSSDFMRQAVLEEAHSMEKILETINPDLVLSYSEFTQVMLPLLRTIGPSFDTKAWLNVVRNEAARVVILDDATGEIKYTIPPIYANVPYGENSGYLGSVSFDLRNIMANNPAAGSSVLYNGLSQLNSSEQDLNAAANEYIAKLNIILKDHDIPEIVTDAPTKVDDAKPDEDSFIVGYDLA